MLECWFFRTSIDNSGCRSVVCRLEKESALSCYILSHGNYCRFKARWLTLFSSWTISCGALKPTSEKEPRTSQSPSGRGWTTELWWDCRLDTSLSTPYIRRYLYYIRNWMWRNLCIYTYNLRGAMQAYCYGKNSPCRMIMRRQLSWARVFSLWYRFWCRSSVLFCCRPKCVRQEVLQYLSIIHNIIYKKVW